MMTTRTIVLTAGIVALVITASVSSYLYLQSSQSLSAANETNGELQAQINHLLDDIDSLSAQLTVQGDGTPSGISVQLADMSSLLTSLKNTQNSTESNAKLSALQAEVNNLQMVVSGCSGSTPVSQAPVGNLTPVLLMQPKTTGVICVTYKAAWSDDSSLFNQLVNGWESIYLHNGSYPFGLSIRSNNGVSQAVTALPSPASVVPSAYVGYVTVLYTVSALQNSTGFYDDSAPYGYCGTMPMAVGYGAFEVNGSDFPPRPPPHSCIAELYSPVGVSVSGMGVTYVDIPPTSNYLSSVVGQCRETGPNYSGYTPCETYDRSEAYVFNCGSSAGASSGCSVHVGNATVGFDLTIWYPITNQTLPGDNCAYVLDGDTYRYFGVCISVSPNSFVYSDPEGLD